MPMRADLKKFAIKNSECDRATLPQITANLGRLPDVVSVTGNLQRAAFAAPTPSNVDPRKSQGGKLLEPWTQLRETLTGRMPPPGAVEAPFASSARKATGSSAIGIQIRVNTARKFGYSWPNVHPEDLMNSLHDRHRSERF
jgi:hypothetical protein